MVRGSAAQGGIVGGRTAQDDRGAHGRESGPASRCDTRGGTVSGRMPQGQGDHGEPGTANRYAAQGDRRESGRRDGP